jgi:serine/threonine protein kinase
MVAESNQHYRHETLQQLLDDDLSEADADRIESHLSDCDDCRAELEQIAGDDSWWDETVSVLSESTIGRPSVSHVATSPSLDPSIAWLQPLLDRSDVGQLGCIDRYPIHELIGQGGMGVVVRGTDPELHRPVAIKVLAPHLAGVGAARARFMREAQAAASIVHPSIVPIYGVITSARLPYIVMPHIRGGNLQQRIDREGPLELPEILRIGTQIAEGLVAAHRGGVIHRDIKPSNMLLEEGNGRVLISDFGLARALDDATLTSSGMIAGTPQYMSPEQARGDLIDARSDLFSLGSLIYALSTGRPPFRAETPLGVLRKVTETSPKPISQINERMPPWLDRLVEHLMQVDPDRRIDSAESAAQMLRAASAHVNNPSVNELPKSLLQQGWQQRSWLLVAGLAVIALAIGLMNVPHWTTESTRDERATDPVAPTRMPLTEASVPVVASDYEWRGTEIDRELAAIHQEILSLSATIDARNESTKENENER